MLSQAGSGAVPQDQGHLTELSHLRVGLLPSQTSPDTGSSKRPSLPMTLASHNLCPLFLRTSQCRK